MLTFKGNPCTNKPYSELPCCTDHVSHWVRRGFQNLHAFIANRAQRVVRVFLPSEGGVAVQVHKHPGAPLAPVRYGYVPGCTALYLSNDDATVLADLLAQYGNDVAATLILTALKNGR
jgi:hypothetical protein